MDPGLTVSGSFRSLFLSRFQFQFHLPSLSVPSQSNEHWEWRIRLALRIDAWRGIRSSVNTHNLHLNLYQHPFIELLRRWMQFIYGTSVHALLCSFLTPFFLYVLSVMSMWIQRTDMRNSWCRQTCSDLRILSSGPPFHVLDRRRTQSDW